MDVLSKLVLIVGDGPVARSWNQVLKLYSPGLFKVLHRTKSEASEPFFFKNLLCGIKEYDNIILWVISEDEYPIRSRMRLLLERIRGEEGISSGLLVLAYASEDVTELNLEEQFAVIEGHLCMLQAQQLISLITALISVRGCATHIWRRWRNADINRVREFGERLLVCSNVSGSSDLGAFADSIQRVVLEFLSDAECSVLSTIEVLSNVHRGTLAPAAILLKGYVAEVQEGRANCGFHTEQCRNAVDFILEQIRKLGLIGV